MTTETVDQAVERVYAFHTKRAPGIYIGTAMVQYALEAMGPTGNGKLNAVCETATCLPDCLQVLAGCTIGVGYQKLRGEIGRYAFSLFNRDTGEGVRVFIDLDKIDPEKTPELHRFFQRTRHITDKNSREESGKKVVEEFSREGRNVLGMQRVQMLTFGKEEILPAKRCRTCRESFLARSENQDICDFCSGASAYYKLKS